MPDSLDAAMMQTRTDLSGEHGDNKAWLASLKRPPTVGRCGCGMETGRAMATEAVRIAGRNWGLETVWLCDGCLRKREMVGLRSSLSRPELKPELRVEYEARLRALEKAAA